MAQRPQAGYLEEASVTLDAEVSCLFYTIYMYCELVEVTLFTLKR